MNLQFYHNRRFTDQVKMNRLARRVDQRRRIEKVFTGCQIAALREDNARLVKNSLHSFSQAEYYRIGWERDRALLQRAMMWVYNSRVENGKWVEMIADYEKTLTPSENKTPSAT